MSPRNILRKLLLCFALGGHSVFGLGMSQEKIEELLYAMNQTRVGVSVSGHDGAKDSGGCLLAPEASRVSTKLN
jgi:hypothetical protein